MNPLLFPPALIKRALDDLSAIGDAARRLPTLEEQVLGRIDRIERLALARVDSLTEELRALRADMAPINELPALRADIAPIKELPALRQDVAPIKEISKVREGIEPLDEDMRAVRHSVDDLEPLIREVNSRLEALRNDLGPLGELADKIPGIGR